MDEKSKNYNLLDEEWIPVLYRDGRSERDGLRVGAMEALKQASEIRCITLASPLDLFAVHRFLLTLLYWKADFAGGVEQVQASLLKGEIPSKVLNGIKEEAHCFNLFDDNSPFLQDTSARDEKKKKSAGSLFAELATGTNIAHFQHGDDENMRLCLPCAALGMLRVVPWSQAGGQGKTPSVHNAPPIMAIATGDNLAVTLGLNLVPLDVEAGEAKWFGRFKPTASTKPITYLEALTWNPRRIFLPSPQKGVCWYCGQADVPVIGKIVYMKNENTKLNKEKNKAIPFPWQDPSAFYLDNGFVTAKSTREELAANGRDLKRLADNDTVPKANVVVKNPDHEGWLLVVPCTNPANNKTFDHRQIELTSLSPETIHALSPPDRPSSRDGLDGWKAPRYGPSNGAKLFVRAAIHLLSHSDWAALTNVAFKDMHEEIDAFDVFSNVHWALRDKYKGVYLSSKGVAWLVLKLMACVPSDLRRDGDAQAFNPLRQLPKRQREGLYPAQLPRGIELEAALRDKLDGNQRQRPPKPISWSGLCHDLDRLID